MSKKIKVGLVGFFGWGNFGDELFVKVFEQWLGDDYELKILNDLTCKPYFTRPVQEVVSEVDAIIIGGGDLIIPWSVSDLYWKSEYLEKPVFIVGVGVPTWRQKNIDVIKKYKNFLMHSNVKFINVRDKESANWIKKNIDSNLVVENSADIVFALNLPKKISVEKKYLGVITRDRKGEGDNLDQVNMLVKKAVDSGYIIKHIILGVGDVGVRDFKRAEDLIIDNKEVVYSESLDELCQEISSCKLIASMKFYGTVVALSYGIPSIVLSPTDKSRNLMRMIEREELLSSLNDPHLSDRLHSYIPVIPRTSVRLLRQRAESTLIKLKNLINSYFS